jgi:hypothetical protein
MHLHDKELFIYVGLNTVNFKLFYNGICIIILNDYGQFIFMWWCGRFVAEFKLGYPILFPK